MIDFSSISKTNLNLNFKNTNKLLNILKNIKVLLNDTKIRNDDMFKVSAKIIDEFNQSKTYHNKLNDLFSTFFENGETTFKIKKLIWAVFIYLRCKLLFISTNFLERLHLLYQVTFHIIIQVPIVYFPSSRGITNENKNENIKEKISSKTQIDKKLFDKTITELPNNLDLSNKDEVQKQIDFYYHAYEVEYIQKNIMFDERVLLSDLFKTDSSPKKASGYISMLKPLSCARQLFSGGDSERGVFAQPKALSMDYKMARTPVDMTPCTRAVTLENWAKNFISKFDPKEVLELQAKYTPMNYNTEMKPLNLYIRKLLVRFEKQLSAHTTRIITSFEDITKMCLKFIHNLLQKDLIIFTEEFCSRLLYNEEYIKALVAISMEIILFIEDIEEISFNRMPEVLELDVYDLWKIMNPIQLRSIVFHKEIKDHLEEVEDQLLSFLIWRNPSKKFLKDIDDFFGEDNIDVNKEDLESLTEFEYKNQSLFLFHKKEDYELDFYKRDKPIGIDIYMDVRGSLKAYKFLNPVSILLRRVSNYSNSLNKTIFDNIGPNNQQEAIESENLLKMILTSKTHIKVLYGRHIDQLVLCVIITILIAHKRFTFSQTDNEIDFNFDFNHMRITMAKLQEIYNKSKPGQVNQVSKMLFKKVKLSDKKFLTMIDYYNESFKVNFREIINNLSIQNGNDIPIKRRKLSINEEEKINSNQEALQSKSAFSHKVENYLPLQKKMNFYENRNGLYGAFFNEFKSKRTQKLKELFPYLVKIESENFVKITNTIDKKLSFSFEGVGKKFDFGGDNTLTGSSKKPKDS